MKTTTKQLKFNLLLFFLLVSLLSFGQSTATYTITFTGAWNNTDHSNNGMTPLPSNDHWSNLVGSTHNSSITFWQAGQMATLGIEDVAERGDNDEFFNEVNAAITAEKANQWIQQVFSPNNAMGNATLMGISVSEDFPLLTLVSMIAPSPDWFTGIHDFSLREGSNWKDTINIDLLPYDAGTEDGMDYDTDNAASNPQQNIFSLVNVPPFNNQKVAILSINLESVLNVPANNFKEGINISPNPTRDNITIINSSTKNIESIEIYDAIGKLIKTLNVNSSENKININLQDLNSGIYLVKVNSTQDHSSLKKLVIK